MTLGKIALHKKTTEEIYDQIAVSYESNYQDDRVGKTVEAENFYIQELMPYQGIGTVLDCGCGTGMFLDLFNIDPSNYTGIDISQKMLDIANKKYPNNSFIKSDFLEHQGLYDFVISLFAIPDCLGKKTIPKAYEMLNKGGVFVSTFINKNGSYKKLYCMETNGIDYAFKSFSYEELTNELHKMGFTWYYILSIVDTTESTDVQEMKSHLINNKHTLAHAKYFFVIAEK